MKRREVKLTVEEKSWLFGKMQSSELKAQAFRRAQILVALDEHGHEMDDAAIAKVLGVVKYTVYSTRRVYIEEGVEKAVIRKVRKDKGEPLKVDGRVEAHIIAIACSEVPNELPQRTLQMFVNELVESGVIESISTESVRQVLKKTR